MKNRNFKSSTGRLSWMLSGVLKSKRAEGYVDTAVKVLIAVVIGALLLFGLYGLVGNVVIPTTTSKVSSLFNTTGVDGAGTGGGAGGGDTPVTPEPEIKREPGSIIPDGAKYTKADGTVLEGNGTNVIPEAPVKNDTYEEGDYIYTYNKGGSCGTKWSVRAQDNTKTEYGVILQQIAEKPITSMSSTFAGCTSLTAAPEIPDTVTSLEYAFDGCTLLTAAPIIPSNVTSMVGTFEGCTSLTTAPAIPSGVTGFSATFKGCTSLTAAPIAPSNATSMFGTFEGCTSLKTYIGSIALDGDFSNYKIPSGVRTMKNAFKGCIFLIAAPEISDTVTDLEYTFDGCTSLTAAPVIPSGVTDMQYTFADCTSLTAAPEIPDDVINMQYTFDGCTSLATAPAIPSSVTILIGTFRDCTSLTGTIEINANPTYFGNCLKNTKITEITGSTTLKTEILATR